MHSRCHQNRSNRKALILFMRYPEAGRVKSRLASAVGPAEAARIYEKLLRRTLGVAGDFKRKNPDVDLFAFFTPSEKKARFEACYPGPWQFVEQNGAHLGERMGEAFRHVFSKACTHALLIGSDIADVEEDDLHQAFRALETGRAVLNRASDGGFYLLGLDRHCPSVFQPEEWSSDRIFERTKNLLEESGMRVVSLHERNDIDRPEDLSLLRSKPLFNQSVSIIIPTLKPVENLQPLLQILQRQLWPDDEVVVVRGSSCDSAPLAAHPFENSPPPGPDPFLSCDGPPALYRVKCVGSPKGRGLQLNQGAREATGDVLWFLHDDCIPPDQFAYLVRKIIHAPSKSLGCFRLAFSPSTPALDMLADWANLRTRFFGLPYGDQGFFCQRETFERMGGFHMPFLMEDVDFARRSRLWGGLLILPEKLKTDPRSYRSKGLLRASLHNHLTMLLYHLGMDNEKLYKRYYR